MSGLENLKEKLTKKIKDAAKKQQGDLEPKQPKIQGAFPPPSACKANNQNFKRNQKACHFQQNDFNALINRMDRGINFEEELNNEMFPQQSRDNMYFDDMDQSRRFNSHMMSDDVGDQSRGLFEYQPKRKIEEQNPQLKRMFLQKKGQQQSWLKPKVQPFLIQGLNENNNEQEIQKQIEIMLRQPQQLAPNQAITTNHEEDQESQKYKQLMLNTIKNKNKTKHKRRPEDKPTPFAKLSPPYQEIKIFASYLPRYQERRNRQLFGNTVDLGVRTLHQVVLQCYLQGIISKDVLLSIDRMGVEKQLQFIKKFAENRLGQYQFRSVKFTPLDYRRLCTILIMHDKQKYTMGERIYSVFKQITDFYHVIYKMNEDQYNKLSNSIIISYKLTWWNGIISKQEYIFGQENQNLDTSTLYQPPLSPLFGADINDPQNDFYKAKKKHYPNKVSDAKLRRSSASSSFIDESHSMTNKNMSGASKDMSGFPIVHQQDENSSNSQQENTRKFHSQFSQRPSFRNSSDSQEEEENQMSEISSMDRSKIRRGGNNDKSVSISESNFQTNKQGMSSINSSRLQDSGDDKSQSLGMSQSVSDEPIDDYQMMDSLSVSSMALRKRNQKRRKKDKKRKAKSQGKAKNKNDSDISVSGSASDDENHDVFMESSDDMQEPRKKKKLI